MSSRTSFASWAPRLCASRRPLSSRCSSVAPVLGLALGLGLALALVLVLGVGLALALVLVLEQTRSPRARDASSLQALPRQSMSQLLPLPLLPLPPLPRLLPLLPLLRLPRNATSST